MSKKTPSVGIAHTQHFIWLVCKERGIGIVCYASRAQGLKEMKELLGGDEFTIREIGDRRHLNDNR